MGQRRESLVLSDAEKERVAFHEGGHAVLAYVLPDADPVHKVTILPTGMALGVTHAAPHRGAAHPSPPAHRGLAGRAHGRPGRRAPGLRRPVHRRRNDLVGNTELARKMVREWGMSDEIGPMAWGSQGQVFLGEDLMHTRDYSEDTSQVIDDEVESDPARPGGAGPRGAEPAPRRPRRRGPRPARRETIDGPRSAGWSTPPTGDRCTKLERRRSPTSSRPRRPSQTPCCRGRSLFPQPAPRPTYVPMPAPAPAPRTAQQTRVPRRRTARSQNRRLRVRRPRTPSERPTARPGNSRRLT